MADQPARRMDSLLLSISLLVEILPHSIIAMITHLHAQEGLNMPASYLDFAYGMWIVLLLKAAAGWGPGLLRPFATRTNREQLRLQLFQTLMLSLVTVNMLIEITKWRKTYVRDCGLVQSHCICYGYPWEDKLWPYLSYCVATPPILNAVAFYRLGESWLRVRHGTEGIAKA